MIKSVVHQSTQLISYLFFSSLDCNDRKTTVGLLLYLHCTQWGRMQRNIRGAREVKNQWRSTFQPPSLLATPWSCVCCFYNYINTWTQLGLVWALPGGPRNRHQQLSQTLIVSLLKTHLFSFIPKSEGTLGPLDTPYLHSHHQHCFQWSELQKLCIVSIGVVCCIWYSSPWKQQSSFRKHKVVCLLDLFFPCGK